MTNRQKAFLNHYLTDCRYSATLAAEAAGYKCRNRHSLQETGRQLLSHPEIKGQIEESFRLSNMSRKEILQELTRLARGDGREKLRALSLLAAHHGILSGAGSDEEVEQRAELLANQKIDSYAAEMQEEVDRYNASVVESNQRKTKFMRELQQMFSHSPETAKALQLMYETATEKITIEQAREEAKKWQPQPEVEIIVPPQRRLLAAPAERMLQSITPDVVETEIVEPEPPPPCGHGYIVNDCYICDHIAATQRAWFA